MKASLSTCLLLALLLPALLTEAGVYFCGLMDRGLGFCMTENGICYRHYYEGYIHGSSIRDKKMGCALNCPSTNYSFSASGEYLKNYVNCCEGDFCNQENIEYSSDVFNGRCRFCDASDPDNCPKLTHKDCYGHETRCIEFVLVNDDSSVPDKVYHGCATPSFCDMARKSPYIDKLQGTITKARCGDTLPDKGELNTEG